jgi:hypothetical protein
MKVFKEIKDMIASVEAAIKELTKKVTSAGPEGAALFSQAALNCANVLAVLSNNEYGKATQLPKTK